MPSVNSGSTGIVASAMRDMMTAWEKTQSGWSDQARADFQKDYLDELRNSVKSALMAMEEIDELLNRARQECS